MRSQDPILKVEPYFCPLRDAATNEPPPPAVKKAREVGGCKGRGKQRGGHSQRKALPGPVAATHGRGNRHNRCVVGQPGGLPARDGADRG